MAQAQPGERNLETVLLFLGNFAEGWPDNYDVALAPLADAASYQMVVPSVRPVLGRAAIREVLQRLQRRSYGVRSRILASAASGNLVFTERIDYAKRSVDGAWHGVPLTAVFELDAEGRITVWREYMDSGAIAAAQGVTAERLLAALSDICDANQKE